MEKETKTSRAKSNDDTTTTAKQSEASGVGELEKNPAFDSIARYLGIDLTEEGKAARNRRGVAVIVHGPPLSGKSRAAISLAKHYECALLTIDGIITEAIATSNSEAAKKVRAICNELAIKSAEEARALEAEQARLAAANATTTQPGGAAVPGQTGGLSIEALAQHSINQGGAGGSKKTSVAGDSHTNTKSNKKQKGDKDTTDQSSTHVRSHLLFSFLYPL